MLLGVAILALGAGRTLAGPDLSGAQPAHRPAETAIPLGKASDATKATKPVGAPASESAAGSPWVLRTAISLAGVLVLIGVVAGIMRAAARRQGGLMSALGAGGQAPAGVLHVLGRYPISRGTTLVLLKLDRRVLLLCQTAGRKFGTQMSTLSEITDPDDVASILLKTRDEEGESIARKFEEMMAGAEREASRTPSDAGAVGRSATPRPVVTVPRGVPMPRGGASKPRATPQAVPQGRPAAPASPQLRGVRA